MTPEEERALQAYMAQMPQDNGMPVQGGTPFGPGGVPGQQPGLIDMFMQYLDQFLNESERRKRNQAMASQMWGGNMAPSPGGGMTRDPLANTVGRNASPQDIEALRVYMPK